MVRLTVLCLVILMGAIACDGAGQVTPSRENCDNGIDDDLDGFVDCADQDCFERDGCPVERCDNGVDDDGDGYTDCADSSCFLNPACVREICDNGVDDDGDGYTDCYDLACLTEPLCIVEACDNGVDDNGDSLVDCDDPDCEGEPACSPEICDNGIDDDSDGFTDCDDYACRMDPYCNGEICDNGVDDDGDGLVDCADPGCFSAAMGWCGECYPFSDVGCNAGQACYISKFDDFVGECYSSPGDVGAGESCYWPDECAPGLYCTDQGSELSRCLVPCYPGIIEECPVGSSCTPFTDMGINTAWGVCM